MADFADEASYIEERHREYALAAQAAARSGAVHHAIAGASHDPVRPRDCDDCGDWIDQARLRVLPTAARCTACQAASERRMRIAPWTA